MTELLANGDSCPASRLSSRAGAKRRARVPLAADPFELWWADREATLRRLAVTSEEDASYDVLMDRLAGLERFIFETSSRTPSALRMKGRLLLWLMEQERHDGLAAMRDIAAFLEEAG